MIGTGNFRGKLKKTKGTASLEIQDNLSSNFVSLDSLVQDINISLIKIDTDGFDFDVIMSSEKIISFYEPILYYENHIKNKFQYLGYKKLIYFLRKKNYKFIYVFDNYGYLIIENASLENLNTYLYQMSRVKYEKSILYFYVLISTEKHRKVLYKTIQEYKDEYNL